MAKEEKGTPSHDNWQQIEVITVGGIDLNFRQVENGLKTSFEVNGNPLSCKYLDTNLYLRLNLLSSYAGDVTCPTIEETERPGKEVTGNSESGDEESTSYCLFQLTCSIKICIGLTQVLVILDFQLLLVNASL